MEWVLDSKNTGGVPIKSWCKNVEPGALEQAFNAAQHPGIIKHIVLLPDCHQGYGVPIGSVVVTKDVVIPYAVGVDIGCLDKDTEFLSPNGWIPISKYQGQKVLQYDRYLDSASFTFPLNYVKKESSGFNYFKNTYGLDQMLSDDHKVLYFHGYRGRGFKPHNYTAIELIQKHNCLKKGAYGGFKTTFGIDTPGLNISDELIRVYIMVSADGRVRKNYVELHFRKERKINRAVLLLEAANINFNMSKWNDGSTCISFGEFPYSKSLSMFWKGSQHQLRIITEECLYWNGHIGLHETFSTTIKEHADVIQYAFAAIGIRANISCPKPRENEQQVYLVYKTQNEYIGITKESSITKVESLDGYEYCFTVPSGYFVARRNNKIFITGNCGMGSVKTSLTVDDMNEEKLKRIYKEITSKIPMGEGETYMTEQKWEGFDNIKKDWSENRYFPIWYEKKAWNWIKRSLGSLGSGK